MEGMPEEKYEDSSQKAERLWQEYETLAAQQQELIGLSEKDREAEMAIFDKIDAVHKEHQINLIVLQEEASKALEAIGVKLLSQIQLAQQFIARAKTERGVSKDLELSEQADEFTKKVDLISSEIPLVEADFRKKLSTMEESWMQKLISLRSDLAGAGGDLKGTRSLLDSNWGKAHKIAQQLKELGEID